MKRLAGILLFCCLCGRMPAASAEAGARLSEQDTVRSETLRPLVRPGTGNASGENRPRVALVLCGGGAKGAAHIGVLKVLEELEVPVDMIVGTSMGAIIGGMYSMGYSAGELDTLISGMNWNFLLSDNTQQRRDASFQRKMMDERFLVSIPFSTARLWKTGGRPGRDSTALSLPGGFVSGQNVLNLMNGLAVGYQDSIDFRDLPVPFACMATDLSTGEQVLLDKGSLPMAMRASMAIPGFFAPVTIDGRVLVDGGVLNNFPVDVARRLGADIVIGVDVQNDLAKPEHLKSINQVLMQLIGLTGNAVYTANVKLTDLYIKPDVTKFSTFSFNGPDIDTLIRNGYRAALEKRDELRALADRLARYGKRPPRLRAPKARNVNRDTFEFARIEVRGVGEKDGRWLLNQVKLRENTRVSGADINRAVSIFSGINAFSSVQYSIRNRTGSGRDTLVFDLTKGPSDIFGFGARFDSEEAAAVLLHVGINTNRLNGSRWTIDGRLSYNPYGRLGYSYVFRNFPRLDMAYMFKSTDMNIYKKGEKNNNISFYYNKIDVSFADRYLRNFNFRLGARFESFNFTSVLSSDPGEHPDLKGQAYLSYYLNARMDDRDNRYFPTDGMYFDAGASYYQTDFHSGYHPFGAVYLGISGAVSAGRATFLPALYARVMMGSNDPLPYRNFLGGSEPGRYVDQQIPFIGINYAETFGSSAAVLRTDLRVRAGEKNHYLYAIANYARTGDGFDGMFRGKGFWGLGFKYAYNTPLGPVGLNIHWSDYNRKAGVYINLGYYF